MIWFVNLVFWRLDFFTERYQALGGAPRPAEGGLPFGNASLAGSRSVKKLHREILQPVVIIRLYKKLCAFENFLCSSFAKATLNYLQGDAKTRMTP